MENESKLNISPEMARKLSTERPISTLASVSAALFAFATLIGCLVLNVLWYVNNNLIHNIDTKVEKLQLQVEFHHGKMPTPFMTDDNRTQQESDRKKQRNDDALNQQKLNNNAALKSLFCPAITGPISAEIKQ